MKTTVIWYVTPCNLVKSTNISQKPAASFFRIKGSAKRKDEDIDKGKIITLWAGSRRLVRPPVTNNTLSEKTSANCLSKTFNDVE